MKVTPLNKEYRGFRLGWAQGRHGFLPAWQHLRDDAWTIGHVYCNKAEEVESLVKDCLDYIFKILAKEILLGESLKIHQLPK